MPPADAGGSIAVERAVLDASVLLGGQRRYLVAAAALGYYAAFWSTWIAGELVRKRTEWVAERAAREKCDLGQMRNGVLLLGSEGLLSALFERWPDAERDLHEYLQESPPGGD